MTEKPTYAELKQKISKLEQEASERKTTEKALRESEKKYRLLTESMADIVWTTNLEFKTTFVSPSIEKILGFTPEERCNQSVEDMITQASLGSATTKLSEFLKLEKAGALDQGAIKMDIEYYTKNGSTVWMENNVQFIRNSENEVCGLLGVSRDITERRKLENKLKESEAQLEAILDASIDSIRLVDKDMRIIWTNKLVETQLQKERKTIIGDYCYRAYTGRSEPCPNCPTVKSLKSKKIEHSIICEENVKGIMGVSYWADYTVPIKNESGEIVNFIQISRDITDIKQAEIALFEEKNRLQIALAEVKKLSGLLPICSHCKKIRDDRGYWNQIESYIHEHSEAEFSHGICKECAEKYYPDMYLYGD